MFLENDLVDHQVKDLKNRSYSRIMHLADTADTALDINLAVGPISSAMSSKLKFSMQFDQTAASW